MTSSSGFEKEFEEIYHADNIAGVPPMTESNEIGEIQLEREDVPPRTPPRLPTPPTPPPPPKPKPKPSNGPRSFPS